MKPLSVSESKMFLRDLKDNYERLDELTEEEVKQLIRDWYFEFCD